ncbi:MAG: glycosyltransferase family 2 protein [Pseudonocardiaceae bacterium]
MSTAPPLVSVGLPVCNGGEVFEGALRSVLAQEHEDLELVISDDASTDGTEEICRHYAQSDSRVRYDRQPENIGAPANVARVLHLARGTFLTWIGADDWLAPSYLSRCLERHAADDRLIVVTTQQVVLDEDGQARTCGFPGCTLASGRYLERFTEILRLLAEGCLPLNPVHGLLRWEPVAAILRPTMLGDGEVFAAKLALAGPWGQVPEVLTHRGWTTSAPTTQLAVPAWQSRATNRRQYRELLAYLHQVPLTLAEQRAARAEVRRLYLRRQQHTAMHGCHKLIEFVRSSAELTPTEAG